MNYELVDGGVLVWFESGQVDQEEFRLDLAPQGIAHVFCARS